MMPGFRYANLQYTAHESDDQTLALILPMIREAAEGGADLIGLPECATRIDAARDNLLATAETEAESRALDQLREAAARHGIWLLIGSMLLRGDDPTRTGRLINRSFLLEPDGNIRARYDKIHLFDADLPDRPYRESETYDAGARAVVVDTPLGIIGLSICYDLRFPALYQALTDAGATILTIPSAFTRPTGTAHWHSLIRARAIENGCYVLAPAQVGIHDRGRETFGHGLIVNPWGEVLADQGDIPGIAFAEITPEAVEKARRSIPSRRHARPFEVQFT